jgi:hypothetical protein
VGSLLYFFAPFLAMQVDTIEIEPEIAIEVEVESEAVEEAPVIEAEAVEPRVVEAQVIEPEPDIEAQPRDIAPSLDVVHAPQLPALETQAERDLRGAIHQRARVSEVHRGFGIASWIGMTATLALGGIQLHDDYGPFASTEADTPCARGEAVFDEFCGDQIPWPHMTAAIVTGTLYYTAATMAFFSMPDPLHIESQDNAAGERLRVHKALRWVHTITMLLTTALGTITANLPPDEVDFDVRRGLALAHMGLGSLTWIFLTAAALVMF